MTIPGHWRCQSHEICANEICIWGRVEPAQRENCVTVSKLGWKSHLSSLTLNIELVYLEFILLDFSLALVQYFLTMSPFLPFEMVMYILEHSMLEEYNTVFEFDFTQAL